MKIEDEITGGIVLTDEIKSDAKETIKQLKELGIKTKMLTGDKRGCNSNSKRSKHWWSKVRNATTG